jgi:hypothetical protein
MREKEILKAAKKRRFSKYDHVRSSAINFLLALLATGSIATKESILGNRLLISPINRFLPLDPDDIVIAILNRLSTDVLPDERISRSVKSVFFSTDQFLLRVANIHGRQSVLLGGITNLDDIIHRFLVDACTTPGNGICFEDRGWYPKLDSSVQDPEYKVYNGMLLRLIFQLRPIENSFHRLLTLKILEKCAELRAPYFSKMQNPVQPSLSFSFISEATLWKEIIALPLPKPFAIDESLPEEPPPATTILANIMPPQLSQRYLAECLFHESALIRHTVCQILFAILNQVKALKSAIQSGETRWEGLLDTTIETIARRLPEASSILRLYSLNANYPLAANCAMNVLLLYGDVLSSVAFAQKTDIKSLMVVLQTEWDFAAPVNLLDKLHLLRFIHDHTEINWWSREGIFNLTYLLISVGDSDSLLAALLKKRISTRNELARQQMEYALDKLIERSNAFQTVTVIHPLVEMCRALDDTAADLEPDASLEIVVEFIEYSFSQFTRKPYSIFDQATSLTTQQQGLDTFSTILVMFAQQWKYMKLNEVDMRKFSILTEWFCNFVVRLVVIGEDSNNIIALLENMNKDADSRNQKISQLLESVSRWAPSSFIRNENFKELLPGSRCVSRKFRC